MKIGNIIREKRKELSLTQEQLADLLGVSAPAVHKWEPHIRTSPPCLPWPGCCTLTLTRCCPSRRI